MQAKREIKNLAASVKERLLKIAREGNGDYQSIFKQYVHERLLYRISLSSYANSFVLKGALLFLAFDISRLRPTKDIDLMGKDTPNDLESIKNIFSEIAQIDCEDGLTFDAENISAERIIEDDNYKGIRIRFTVRLGKATDGVQIDIGFGDVIHKGPIKIEYPTLLDFTAPSILAYSIESAIAEKFEAIVSLGMATSRMKDFYDILFFAQKNKFDSVDLLEAIKLTFNNRNTAVDLRNLVFADNFKKDLQKQIQWQAFLKKKKLEADDNFEIVVTKLENFIEPLFDSSENKRWDSTKWSWE